MDVNIFFEGLYEDYVSDNLDSETAIQNLYRLTETTKSWLFSMNEIDDEDLEKRIKEVMRSADWRNRDLNFGPEFPEERTYFPLKGVDDEEVEEYLDVPREISEYLLSKGYVVDDYKKGIAKKKDNENRKIKIGKLLKSKPDLKKAFDGRLQVADERGRLQGRMKDTNRLTVVFTYNPRDIAMMSTKRGWTSCANLEKGGPAADQIPNKIEAGGMVAYLINSHDKNIEHPVARISIRRFVSMSNGSFILLPEKTCYGADVDEFEEFVEEKLEENNSETSDDSMGIFKDAEGGYSDTFAGFISRWGDMPDASSAVRELAAQGKYEEMGDVLDTIQRMVSDDEMSPEEAFDPSDLYEMINDAISSGSTEMLDPLLDFLETMHGDSYSGRNSFAYWFEELDVDMIIERVDNGMMDNLLRRHFGYGILFNMDHLLELMKRVVYGYSQSSKIPRSFDKTEQAQEMINDLLSDNEFNEHLDWEYVEDQYFGEYTGTEDDRDVFFTYMRAMRDSGKEGHENYDYADENFSEIMERIEDNEEIINEINKDMGDIDADAPDWMKGMPVLQRKFYQGVADIDEDKVPTKLEDHNILPLDMEEVAWLDPYGNYGGMHYQIPLNNKYYNATSVGKNGFARIERLHKEDPITLSVQFYTGLDRPLSFWHQLQIVIDKCGAKVIVFEYGNSETSSGHTEKVTLEELPEFLRQRMTKDKE